MEKPTTLTFDFYSQDGFVHVLQQVSSEGLDSLQDYWITRVKNVALRLEKEDKQLLDDYNALKVHIHLRRFKSQIFHVIDFLRFYKIKLLQKLSWNYNIALIFFRIQQVSK